MPDLIILEMGKPPQEIIDKIGDFSSWILKLIPDKYKNETKIILSKDFPSYIDTNLNALKGVIITGSHDMVTEPNDEQKKTFDTLKNILINLNPNLPIFGICYGHQLLAELLGGKASFRKNGAEIGLVDIKFNENDDPIFKGLSNKTIKIYCSHYQCAEILPENAKLLAYSNLEKHQAFRYKNCWGVQFHPEFPKEGCIFYEKKFTDKNGLNKRVEYIEKNFVNNNLIEKFCDFVFNN